MQYLFIVNNPYHGYEIPYPVLILALMILAFSCVTGRIGKSDNYSSTPKQALPGITPRVSPPPVSPPQIPSFMIFSPAGQFGGSLTGAQRFNKISRIVALSVFPGPGLRDEIRNPC